MLFAGFFVWRMCFRVWVLGRVLDFGGLVFVVGFTLRCFVVVVLFFCAAGLFRVVVWCSGVVVWVVFVCLPTALGLLCVYWLGWMFLWLCMICWLFLVCVGCSGIGFWVNVSLGVY